MRIAYLDEAGIGKLENEPYTVVAGVLVQADNQWRLVQEHLRGLITKYIPEPDRDGFSFHATELLHGNGGTPRDKYPQELRLQILDELCQLPKQLALPIVFGVVDRAAMAKDFIPEMKLHDVTVFAQVSAALLCTVDVEKYMYELGAPNETCLVVYENNDHCRELVRSSQNVLTNPHLKVSGALQSTKFGGMLPLKYIVDSAHFAEKSEAIILQLADVIAFALKRKINGKADADRWFQPLLAQMRTTRDRNSPFDNPRDPKEKP